MADIAVCAEKLSKRYSIGQLLPYQTLRESLTRLAGRALGSLSSTTSKRRTKTDTIWALEDVSFELQRGEVLGIIGRNGAGKSTLLKILTRITEPSSGYADIYGRVGSLLEVGTGFHNELTGRENVFLNGAVLGMSREEITRKFEEIVAFAGVERFIDTPVKRFSSGMKVRLGFAVAAHLEPEILLVDEVLAVGDFEFQRKCVGAMSEVARGGRTVIFVSHDMAAIEALCTRVLVLEGGKVAFDGPVSDAIRAYVESSAHHASAEVDLTAHGGRRKRSTPLLKRARLETLRGTPTCSLAMKEGFRLLVEFDTSTGPLVPCLGVLVKTAIGAPVFTVNNKFLPTFECARPVSGGTIVCHVETLPLTAGAYSIDLYFGDRSENKDVILDALNFDVYNADVFGTGKLPPPGTGPMFWDARWSLLP